MNKTPINLLLELDKQLHFIKSEAHSPEISAKISIQTIIKITNKLKLFIVKHKFINEKEEITFFKKIKPQFVARFIYQKYVYKNITQRPLGCSNLIKEYFNLELIKLHHKYENNFTFFKYYRTDSEHLDHVYFVRGKVDFNICFDNLSIENDDKFSTNCDFLVADFMANEFIELYLKNEIAAFDNLVNTNLKPQVNQKSVLNWTAPKVALVELLYAFYADGCFNNGNANISQIANVFEAAFNIELKHFSRIFLEINSRKMGRTKYLDNLRVKLINKLNETNPDI